MVTLGASRPHQIYFREISDHVRWTPLLSVWKEGFRFFLTLLQSLIYTAFTLWANKRRQPAHHPQPAGAQVKGLIRFNSEEVHNLEIRLFSNTKERGDSKTALEDGGF